jgi:CRISPR-associated protein Csm1
MNDYPKETLWLAALLHDLGKFRQRAEPEAGVTHQEHGRKFVQDEFGGYFQELNPDLAQAIAGHHKNELTSRLAKLVKIADRLSMPESPAETSAELIPPWEPLSALLTLLPYETKKDEPPPPIERKRIRLQTLPLQSEDMHPIAVDFDDAAVYKTLWTAFEGEFRSFTNKKEFEPADITTILSLLHKYTSSMPAETAAYQPQPKTPLDISLYMHLKTTAAIAAGLNNELNDDEIDALLRDDATLSQRRLCALVKGDISGTQDFIYLLTGDGAARGLRARSFYVQLLTETIAQWILRQAGLSELNLIFAGGGHFYVLLPFTTAKDQIGVWQKNIAEILWRGHRGDLYLNLGHVPVEYNDFLETGNEGASNFADKWSEVTKAISMHKQRKWLEIDPELMQSFFFTPRERGGDETRLCSVCRFESKDIRPVEESPEIRKCKRCREFEQLGRELRDPAYMVTFISADKDIKTLPTPTWKNVLAAFGARIILAKKGEHIERAGTEIATISTFDSADFLSDNCQWDSPPNNRSFRLLAGATPSKPNDKKEHGYEDDEVVAEFGDLAQAADGAKWLGALRMDVDSLGKVFRNRLGKRANIARMSTLSESLRLFFESRVPQLCRECNPYSAGNGQKKDRLFLLYAGGDDLFLVGAWSELPALAKKIRDEFRRFAGGDHLTLSAGIAIEHDKYPLYQLANDAKHALDDRAKVHQRQLDGRTIEKDAICFLQNTVGWKEFEVLKKWQEELVQMIEPENNKPRLPRGFLTRLGQIYSLFVENRKSKRKLDRQGGELQDIQEMIYYEKWRWHLVYQLGRFTERYPAYTTIIRDLQKQIIDNKLIDNLNVIARWAELLTRKE